MKRMLVIFCFVNLLPSFLFSQRRTDGRSRSLIRFGNTTINIQNDFITDSGRKVFPEFIQFPFQEEVYFVTGPKLVISVINMDSVNYFSGGFNGLLIDTLQNDNKLLSLTNLQVRLNRSNKVETFWKEATSFPCNHLSVSEAAMKNNNPNYIILDDSLQVNETLLVDIKSKEKKDVVLHLRFTRESLPIVPYRAMMMHDSSTITSEAEFIKSAIETGNTEFKIINSFYKNWPSKYGAGQGNQSYFPSSKLAFYFRKYNDSYQDSSLQYALLNNDNIDTLWHSSGHLVLITKLSSNTRYTLLVRYKEAPDNLWQEHFYVPPAWYQATPFYITTSLLTGLVSVSIIFFIVHRRKLKIEKRKLEKLQLEQHAVRSQLNPHFTFNALSSIQSLMNQNRLEEANHYFTEFSSLLRSSLHNGGKEMLPLKEELALLEQYIKLEQLRFPFQYRISVDKSINTSATEIPSLLLQPLVENAIRHGISGLQEKGILITTVKSENKTLLIHIDDNGAGFTQTETKGYGLLLTKERINLLNQALQEQSIELTIDSGSAGTTVLLSFRNWL